MKYLTNTPQTKSYKELQAQVAKESAYSAFKLNAHTVAPLKSEGYLVKKQNPFSATLTGISDTGKDVVNLTKALKDGKSNDHNLGRFNDVGLKLGGLGIAAFLSTRRGTQTKGLMEFLGFGTFFSTMALWPEVLIAKPLENKFGFDIRQKFVDSQGRKKNLFQDNQYVPDLYSKDELKKIGDKFGIPQDTPNYENVVKDHMRKVALQGNTLWMLTAGASPLVTSLLCNAMEKPLTDLVVDQNYKNVLKNADNIDEKALRKASSPLFGTEGAKTIKSVIGDGTQVPTKETFATLADALNPLKVVLEEMKLGDIDNENIFKRLTDESKVIQDGLEKTYKELVEQKGGISFESLEKAFEDAAKKGKILDNQGDEIPVREYLDQIKASLSVNGEMPSTVSRAQIDNAIDFVAENDTLMTFKKIAKKAETSVDKETLEAFYQQVSQTYATQTRPMAAKLSVSTKYINTLVGQKYESVINNYSFKSVDAFINRLNPTVEELNLARKGETSAFEFLTKKLGDITLDDDSYAGLVRETSKQQAKLEALDVDTPLSKIRTYLDDAFSSITEGKNDPLSKAIRGLVEKADNGEAPTFRKVLDLFSETSVGGIKATNHRLLLAADTERRIQTGTLLEQWKEIHSKSEVFDSIQTAFETKGQDASAFRTTLRDYAELMSKEGVSEELIENFKSAQATKLGLSADDMSELFKAINKNGADVIQYSDAEKIARSISFETTMNGISNKCFLSGNNEIGEKIFRLTFNSDLDPKTIENCDGTVLDALKGAKDTISTIFRRVQSHAHLGYNFEYKDFFDDLSPQTKYAKVGNATVDLIKENASKMYNDKHWMKMFGGLTIAALGLTLIPQLFFGKVNKQDIGGKDANK